MSSKTAPELAPAAARPRQTASWSLAARLTAWYAGSGFLLILLATGFLYWVLATNLDREDDELLTDKARILRGLLREKPNDARPLEQEVKWEWAASRHAQFSMRIMDADGKVVLETPGMSEELPAAVFPKPAAFNDQRGTGSEWQTSSGKSYRLLAAQGGIGAPGSPVLLLQVALDRSYEEDLLARYRGQLWLVLGLSLVVCTLVGYRIARRGLRPVSEIAEAARRIRSTTLNERIQAAGLPAELSALAETFNEMLDRLEESFGRLDRFSADIAHELRTPVHNLRGEAEVALARSRSAEEYREVLGSCLEEAARLSRLIDSLLFLARAESANAQLVRERLDLGRELATVREFYEAAAAEGGIRLQVDAPAGIIADLDRALFQRAVGNLVANALAHTPSGGQVCLKATRDSGLVHVEVADTGCGISPEHLPHVFDRFYRADQTRSTGSGRTGLGLAIVRNIAALHQGRAEIQSAVGQGTRVTLIFPRDEG
jgi:two-component system heavy metal sensor histidine kinase CusS